jgi:WhiB family redox-sensing transcriptional regulator
MTLADIPEMPPPADAATNLRYRPGYATVAGRWTLRAACLHADPELFFPEVLGAIGADRTSQAKQFCAGCPVRDKCLGWALGTGEAYGIWGGTTPDERRVIRARHR